MLEWDENITGREFDDDEFLNNLLEAYRICLLREKKNIELKKNSYNIFLIFSKLMIFVITSYSIHYTKLYENICTSKKPTHNTMKKILVLNTDFTLI